MNITAKPVVTDLTVQFSTRSISPSSSELDPRKWHRVEKDLCLDSSPWSAWLHLALAKKEELTNEDLLITDIRIGKQPADLSPGESWEKRPCSIWLLRSRFAGSTGKAVTGVDVLFGVDAVDPRPQWTLLESALQLEAPSDTPVARLSVHRGKARPNHGTREALRVREDGKFKIVQISDTHMVTGVGVCSDAIDADGKYLPNSKADPLTTNFIGGILDVERPDLVVLTGDQLHHDITDSQSALFKVVAPIIERSIPFAAVFGNHDSEGAHALSRTAQMSILQDLPFSRCEPGPQQVDGTGNYHLNILAPAPSQSSVSSLYCLDSHSQIPSKTSNPDYQPITQSQIDWFVKTSQTQCKQWEKEDNDTHFHISLAFFHIPVPEFGDPDLWIRKGCRREPTEGPSVNSHFYDALVQEGISAIGCGHDHVNDFCALLPRQDGDNESKFGPWLCYAGTSGFGGYCSYGGTRFHRRMRVWELDTYAGTLKTWLRVEYEANRVDELVLVECGEIAWEPQQGEDKCKSVI